MKNAHYTDFYGGRVIFEMLQGIPTIRTLTSSAGNTDVTFHNLQTTKLFLQTCLLLTESEIELQSRLNNMEERQ